MCLMSYLYDAGLLELSRVYDLYVIVGEIPHWVSYWHCWGIGPPQTADAFCQIIKRSQTLNWLESVIIVLSPGSPCILFKPHSLLRSVGFTTTDISLGSYISEKVKEETLFLEMLGKAFLRRKLKTTAEMAPYAKHTSSCCLREKDSGEGCWSPISSTPTMANSSTWMFLLMSISVLPSSAQSYFPKTGLMAVKTVNSSF